MLLIKPEEILMGRDQEYPISATLLSNLNRLVSALNIFRTTYGIPMIVSSGYRPGHYNTDAGGASNSAHKTCEAADFHDQDRNLVNYCLANLDLLAKCGLWLESPDHTPGWCHLQTRPIPSGHRVFIP